MGAAQRIEKWCWILIFLGILLLSLGLSVQRSDVTLGWGIAGTGIVMIGAGIALIWVRSRMKNSAERHRPKETA